MRRARGAAAAAVVGLLTAVGLGFILPDDEPAAVPAPARAPVAASGPAPPPVAARPALMPPTAVLPITPPGVSEAVPHASAAPPPRPVVAGPAAQRDHWDLCDIGRLPLAPGADPDEPPQHVFDALAAGLAPQWPAALATASDRSRAAARRLGLTAEAAAGPEPVPLSMAEASADPVISAWAAQGCASDDACRAAATRRWLALEPDNLAPRLWALGDGQRLDAAALQALATAAW